jgi:hypothetical protein
MLAQRTNENAAKECFKSRISYIEHDDVICIEHFSGTGQLLSEVRMDYEAALGYARLIMDITDKALGIE